MDNKLALEILEELKEYHDEVYSEFNDGEKCAFDMAIGALKEKVEKEKE